MRARILNAHHRCAILKLIGEWRSLVAHLHGVQGAAGSNPVSPTSSNHASTFALRPARL